MARFPEEEIQRLKREISVADLARAHGVVLTKSGEDFIGLCPFHDDREPSMIITPSNNLWHCLGACQAERDRLRDAGRARELPARGGDAAGRGRSERQTRASSGRGAQQHATQAGAADGWGRGGR